MQERKSSAVMSSGIFFFWGNVALPSGYRIPCFLNLGLSVFIPNTATA